jgi:hypothetical protein
MSVRFSRSTSWRAGARTAAALITVALLAACADQPGPTALNANGPASLNTVSSALGLASPAWQEKARTFVGLASMSPINAGHAYPLLGVAQYLAVQQAETAIGITGSESSNNSTNGVGAGGRSLLETDRGAVAGASVVVLKYLFPSKATEIDALLATQANAGPGGPQAAFAAGEAIGRAVGADIVTRATHDGFSEPNTAAPSTTGPEVWISSTNPATLTAGGQFPGMILWFPTLTPHEFRSPPPPAFTSARFATDLAEIRQISDTRTAGQGTIAEFWALNAGTPTASGFWLEYASNAIAHEGDWSERNATHLFALLSATMADATIACWDTKLTYWLVRPWNADALITTLAKVGKPNHPSYPSGHSCVSSSAGEVLSTFFPGQRTHIADMVTEAGLSRMYAGIHYRFDIEAGQALGKDVALFTIAADRSGHSILASH